MLKDNVTSKFKLIFENEFLTKKNNCCSSKSNTKKIIVDDNLISKENLTLQNCQSARKDVTDEIMEKFEKLSTKSKNDIAQKIEKLKSNNSFFGKHKYTEAFKIQVVKEAYEHNNNLLASEKMNVPEPTVRLWRSKYTSKEVFESLKKTCQKRRRNIYLVDLENLLIEWLKEVRNTKIGITNYDLTNKAIELKKIIKGSILMLAKHGYFLFKNDFVLYIEKQHISQSL
jgi:hypothetical protein